jgi:aryl-alcohol dehydrogenase-like predicted oxidoreductase
MQSIEKSQAFYMEQLMIEKRTLGSGGPKVGRIGYGAMVLEGYYGASHEDESVGTIHRALDAGITLLDSADAYGNGHNEQLIGRAIKGRSDAFIATKFGIVFDPSETGSDVPTGWGFSLKINGRPDYAERCLNASLKRLGVATVDLWYLHYPDPDVPIEETVGAMAAAVAAGKVRCLGLSNVSAEQVRRAHSVFPITAVQYEYSLWRREAESSLLPTLRELGVAMVAWSPLGAGFLTGAVESLGPGDFRHYNPRFSGENLPANTSRFAPLIGLAREFGLTPAQLALAWLLHQGEQVFPIPGTRRSARISENADASAVRLSAEQLKLIDQTAPPGITQGATLV